MKTLRKQLSLLLLFVCVLGLTACGKSLSSVTESTCSFDKDGVLTVATVETFAEDYYNTDELESTINSELAAYNANESKITKKSLQVKDGVAKLVLVYDSAEDYAQFNNQPIFYGTVSEASHAGYDLSSLLSSVNTQDASKILSSEELSKLEENKVVILTEPMHVIVPGTVLYSTGNVQLTGSGEGQVTETAGTDNPAIMLLK